MAAAALWLRPAEARALLLTVSAAVIPERSQARRTSCRFRAAWM